MAIEMYNQHEHDFALEIRQRIAGTKDEHATVRKVQETLKDASYDEVRDGILKLAKSGLQANPAFALNPVSELSALEDEQIYSALQGAIEHNRAKANGSAQTR